MLQCQNINPVVRKEKKKKRDKLTESQKGGLNRYFPAGSTTTVENHRQESEPAQDDDHNLKAWLNVNF